MRLVAIDIKTTGLSPMAGDRIVEIGAIEISGGEIQDERLFHRYVDPLRDIPEAAERIHGVNLRLLREQKARCFSDIAPDFLAFIKDATLVLHNAAFDLTFLRAELARSNLPDIGGMDVIDSLQMARQLFPDNWNTPEELCARLSHICPIIMDDSSAQGAARTLADIYLVLLNELPEPPAPESVRDVCREESQTLKSNPLFFRQKAADVVVSNFKQLAPLMVDIYQEMEDKSAGRIEPGVQTGFMDLDRILVELHRGDLVLLAARPGMQASMLATNIISNIALRSDREKIVLVLSLTMTESEWATRMLASEAWVDMRKMQTGKFSAKDWRCLAASSGALAEARIFVDHHRDASIQSIANQCRSMADKVSRADLIVIDDLQSIQAEGQSGHDMSGITGALKLLAQELDLPVLLLSRLGNALEQREDKRPILSDLNEFGCIEQDADTIIFLYRDYVYHNHSQQKGIAEVIVAKHWCGSAGMVKLAYLDQCMRFESLARE